MAESCFLSKHLEKLFHFGLCKISVKSHFFTPLKELLLKKYIGGGSLSC